MDFDLPKEKSSIIKVIGVGGGGSNAVNHMFHQGITGVNFVVCNTDAQALEMSPVPNKIQLGPSLTEGRGAGSKPQVGREATEESIEELKEILATNTKMVFITAGMGGGTGTGGAPVIAQLAKDMDILTVGIVTIPFRFEGTRRNSQATAGLEEMRDAVDTLIVISNERIREIYGNLKLSEAFANADDILTTASKGIAEIITVPGYINVDFEDVKTVMQESGVAIMGSASAEGEHRALRAVEAAISSPLLNDNDIMGARHILLNISSGDDEVSMDEIAAITDFIQENSGAGTDVIWGNCHDASLGDKLSVTIIATGFESRQERMQNYKPEKKVLHLDGEMDLQGAVQEEEESKERNQITFDFEDELEEEMAEPQLKSYPGADTEETEKEEELPSDVDADIVAEFTMLKKNKERANKIKPIGLKFSNPNQITEMENEPAYKRRNVPLDQTPHSSDESVSRYSLVDDGKDEEGPKLRKNNSFLHDNVD